MHRSPRRRAGVVALVVGLVLAACCAVAVPGGAGTTDARDPGPYAGLGAGIDAFDYAPAFQGNGGTVSITPDAVPDMAALGVETLFLQAAMNDATRSPEKIVDARLVGEFLRRAHREGMQVVAWYYPTLDDPAVDLEHVEALVDFTYRGQQFDSIALDIESRAIEDVDERNDAVVKLAKQTRALVGEDEPIGAAVYPAVQAEVVNPALWPRFPYKRLAKYVDVWMPMAYWTYRDGDYRDPYRYTEESIRRLRANLGDKKAMMHPIGGLAAESTAQDYDAFLRAVYDTDSVGWSVYDYSTTFTSVWPQMRTGGVPTTTTTTSSPSTTRRAS